MIRSVALFCLLFTTSNAVAETTVTFALANNYEPLMAQDGGIAGDILDEANARLPEGYSIVVEISPWARGVAKVERGEVQALVGTYYRPEIRPWIEPYSEPLLQDPVSVYCHTGVADPAWNYPADYAGLDFGFLIGSYAAGPEFAAMREAGSITVRENTTILGNLKMLKSGRIDCFVEGRYSIQSELSTLGNTDDIERVTDVASEDFYVGFQRDWAASDNASEFILAFNETIRDMRTDGTIDRILHDALN